VLDMHRFERCASQDTQRPEVPGGEPHRPGLSEEVRICPECVRPAVRSLCFHDEGRARNSTLQLGRAFFAEDAVLARRQDRAARGGGGGRGTGLVG